MHRRSWSWRCMVEAVLHGMWVGEEPSKAVGGKHISPKISTTVQSLLGQLLAVSKNHELGRQGLLQRLLDQDLSFAAFAPFQQGAI